VKFKGRTKMISSKRCLQIWKIHCHSKWHVSISFLGLVHQIYIDHSGKIRNSKSFEAKKCRRMWVHDNQRLWFKTLPKIKPNHKYQNLLSRDKVDQWMKPKDKKWKINQKQKIQSPKMETKNWSKSHSRGSISPEEQRLNDLSGDHLSVLWELKCSNRFIWHRVLISFNHQLFFWKISNKCIIQIVLTHKQFTERNPNHFMIQSWAEHVSLFHHILIVLQCFYLTKAKSRFSSCKKEPNVQLSLSPQIKETVIPGEETKSYKNKQNIRVSQQWNNCRKEIWRQSKDSEINQLYQKIHDLELDYKIKSYKFIEVSNKYFQFLMHKI
jgi:hypothetical protein